MISTKHGWLLSIRMGKHAPASKLMAMRPNTEGTAFVDMHCLAVCMNQIAAGRAQLHFQDYAGERLYKLPVIQKLELAVTGQDPFPDSVYLRRAKEREDAFDIASKVGPQVDDPMTWLDAEEAAAEYSYQTKQRDRIVQYHLNRIAATKRDSKE